MKEELEGRFINPLSICWDMSHTERKDRSIRERLHTTLDSAVMEILRAHAPSRGMGSWLEEAVLSYAMSQGDRAALDKRERALHSKKSALQAQMEELAAELALVQVQLQEVQTMKQTMEGIDPELFLKRIDESMERWYKPLREVLGSRDSPVDYENIELEDSPLEHETYGLYKANQASYDHALKAYIRSHQGLIKDIQTAARRQGILINDTLLHDYLEPRIREAVDQVVHDMTADSRAAAERRVSKKLERMQQVELIP